MESNLRRCFHQTGLWIWLWANSLLLLDIGGSRPLWVVLILRQMWQSSVRIVTEQPRESQLSKQHSFMIDHIHAVFYLNALNKNIHLSTKSLHSSVNVESSHWAFSSEQALIFAWLCGVFPPWVQGLAFSYKMRGSIMGQSKVVVSPHKSPGMIFNETFIMESLYS